LGDTEGFKSPVPDLLDPDLRTRRCSLSCRNCRNRMDWTVLILTRQSVHAGPAAARHTPKASLLAQIPRTVICSRSHFIQLYLFISRGVAYAAGVGVPRINGKEPVYLKL